MPQAQFKPRDTRLLPLSGRSNDSLRALMHKYLALIDANIARVEQDPDLMDSFFSDVAWSAGVTRDHYDHRCGIMFPDVDSLKTQLLQFCETEERGPSIPPAKIAFAYTGQGSQWAGMGKAIYETEPVARAVFDRCEEVFQEARGESLLDVMFDQDGQGERMIDTAWEQPALYALECALTALWASVGIKPDAVMGHSIGELIAAHTAGVYSLEDGMRFAAARGTLFSNTEPGSMLAVFAPLDRVEEIVAAENESSIGIGLSIAADNGSHRVVSGPTVEIDSITNRFKSEKVRSRRLNTTRAFHSAMLDPALDALENSLNSVSINPPSITVVSNLTGKAVDADQPMDGSYWRQHARQPVSFASGVKTLAELGVDLVIEIGPRPLLSSLAVASWPESVSASPPLVVASLKAPARDGSIPKGGGGFMSAVAELYNAGLSIDFEGLYTQESRSSIDIPDH